MHWFLITETPVTALQYYWHNIIATQLWQRGCHYRRFEWEASSEWNKSMARDGQRSHENLSSVILKWTYILESLEAAPPVTLATSNCDNSVLSSSSCFRSSSFFFPRSSWAFTFTWSTTKHPPCKQYYSTCITSIWTSPNNLTTSMLQRSPR